MPANNSKQRKQERKETANKTLLKQRDTYSHLLADKQRKLERHVLGTERLNKPQLETLQAEIRQLSDDIQLLEQQLTS